MRKIYAADFSEGTIHFYCSRTNLAFREANPLNTPGGEPSGYALTKRNQFWLGLELYQLSYENLRDLDSFHINIKAKPDENHRAELVQYFKTWLEKMKEDYPEEFKGIDEPFWFINYPMSDEWKAVRTRDLYQSLFEEAGYENVFIIPESNAVFAFYQQTTHIMNNYRPETQFLVFDQSAYSLNMTYYNKGKISSYGGYLGTSLIERMMLHVILKHDEKEIRLKKRSINFSETVQFVRTLIEKEGYSGKVYTYLLLCARVLKEEYFTAQRNKTLKEKLDITTPVDLNLDPEEYDQFSLFTNLPMMQNILENWSVKEILGDEFFTLAPEVQNEIGNKTWMQTFRVFLSNLDNEYPNIKNGENTIIMLTGGGSLMNCITDTIKEHYPEATVYCDKEAISAVGKGMAYWAPDIILAIEFKQVFSSFIDREYVDEAGNTINYINHILSDIAIDCVTNLIKAIVSEEVNSVMYATKQWREYSCDNTEIGNTIEIYLKNWCKSTGMSSFINHINMHISSLKSQLNADFNEALLKSGLTEFELFKEDTVFLSYSIEQISEVFNFLVDMIGDHYKKHTIWNEFLNDKRGIFSDKRTDFYNANVEALNKWMRNEAASTSKLCKELFFDKQYKVTDTVSYTVYQLIQVEARLDLNNLMKIHLKRILGNLVLEDYLDFD